MSKIKTKLHKIFRNLMPTRGMRIDRTPAHVLEARKLLAGVNLVGFSEVFSGNFGDLVGPYIYQKLTGKTAETFPVNKQKVPEERKHFLIIGSILHFSTNQSHLWGIGLMKARDVEKHKEVFSASRIFAVRGPITRKHLISSGIISERHPLAYGDPAILLPLFHNPECEKKYEIGLIPHVKDYEKVKERYKDQPHVRVIQLGDLGYEFSNIEPVIDEIKECQRVISSSLHGVIVCHSYDVPVCWANFTEVTKRGKSGTSHTKFKDYYLSVALECPNPVDLTTQLFSEADLTFTLPEKGKIEELQKGLINFAPFNISHNPLSS
ncbi:polysaccharide pyruvyl transferase family protein [Alteromonas ponticola]|uniref:Polysaccharide pyruvyl transferase family protein n=1 Tax=Alteromonas aquimaris TaxID=2998417 RepID=A0ABT3P7K4_9ALTE|nr:polysaccharide pyruvyl transferase family protein [Alteromonas aquimaris]MCW8108061.1 polysaccharide pyruvyl transferase family protein [Alteromonas aquimaris]